MMMFKHPWFQAERDHIIEICAGLYIPILVGIERAVADKNTIAHLSLTGHAWAPLIIKSVCIMQHTVLFVFEVEK